MSTPSISIDQVDDRNAEELVRFAQACELPTYVKQADMTTLYNDAKLPPTLYADVQNRKFPCNTAAATWLSCLYFQNKQAAFSDKQHREKVAACLDKYAEYFGIKSDVNKMRKQVSDFVKKAENALSDANFAYVWQSDDGTHKVRYLPIRNALETKQAAVWLQENRNNVEFSDRKMIATRILNAMQTQGAGLGEKLAEFIQKQACLGIGDTDEIVHLVINRATYTKNASLREAMQKIAETLKHDPSASMQPDMLVKLAQTIDSFDKSQGLVCKYDVDPNFHRPEDVIFKTTFYKIAEVRQSAVATTSGRIYEKQAFKQLDIESVKSAFGDEFVERVTTPLGEIDPEKFAEEAATLPLPEATVLDSLLSDSGVSPILNKTASAQIDPSVMAAWASIYETLVSGRTL